MSHAQKAFPAFQQLFWDPLVRDALIATSETNAGWDGMGFNYSLKLEEQ